MLLPVLFAAIVGFAHFLSDKFYFSKEEHKMAVASFIGGVSVIYLFMKLYPEFYKDVGFSSPFMLTAVMLGFSLLFLVDKLIYQNIRHHKVSDDVKLAHGYGLVVYYVVVGITLVHITAGSTKDGVLFFIPLFIYAAISGMASHGIHGIHGPHYDAIIHVHIIQSFAIIAGAQFAILVALPTLLTTYLVGFVAGVMTYIVVRDMLPKGKQGRPLFYVIGSLSYLVVLVSVWHL